MSCGTTPMASRKLSCVTRAISCPSIRMRPALHIVEALQQREHRRLAAAGTADQADAFARPEAQVEILENLLAVAVAEVDVLELDAGAAPDQRLGLGMVAQFVRHQERRQRLRQARDMLGDVDQRHGEVARRVQHRKSRACRSAPRRRSSPRPAATARSPRRAGRAPARSSPRHERCAAFRDRTGCAGAPPFRARR